MRLDPDTLEVIALMLEKRNGNALYRKAWLAAAKQVRLLRTRTDEHQKLNDVADQIGSLWPPEVDARASHSSR